jgi:hypothetical protein
MSFKQKGYEIVRNAISHDCCRMLETEFKMLRDVMKMCGKEQYFDNDTGVQKSFTYYGAFAFDSLSLFLQDKISVIVEEPVYPAFSTSRIMRKGSSLPKHYDRPEGAEIGVTMLISRNGPIWNLNLIDFDKREVAADLDVGDMCIFEGSQINHWRDPYEGEEVVQTTMSFVRANGKYSEYKYDKRPYLGFSVESKSDYNEYYEKRGEIYKQMYG